MRIELRSTGASVDAPVLHFHGRGRWGEKISPFCTNALKNCRIRMEKTFTFTLYSFT